MKTKLFAAFADYPPEWYTTATVTSVESITESASLLISHSLSTILRNKVAIRVTNKTESFYLIRKKTQIAEFSVVTPEQSKFIQPVDTAILSMITEGDPDLTTYMNQLLTAKKLEQQNNTLWYLTLENPGKTEDHTPIWTRILREPNEFLNKKY